MSRLQLPLWTAYVYVARTSGKMITRETFKQKLWGLRTNEDSKMPLCHLFFHGLDRQYQNTEERSRRERAEVGLLMGAVVLVASGCCLSLYSHCGSNDCAWQYPFRCLPGSGLNRRSQYDFKGESTSNNSKLLGHICELRKDRSTVTRSTYFLFCQSLSQYLLQPTN